MPNPPTNGTEETPNTSQEATDSSENDEQVTNGEVGQEHSKSPAESDTETQETFSKGYVQELRSENAKHRTNAARADALATALVAAYVETTGRLHDASDLPVDDSLFVDGMPNRQKVTEAVEALIERKPHLAKIRPVGDIGQGHQGSESLNADALFGNMLRDAAG